MPCYIPVRPTRGAVLDTFTIKGHYLFRYWMTKDYVRTPDFVSDGKHIRAGRGVVAVGLLSGVSESIVSNIVCGYLDRYSGKDAPTCGWPSRRTGPVSAVVDNASKEGVMDLNQARYWTRKFPGSRGWSPPATSSGWPRRSGGHRARHRRDARRPGMAGVALGRFRSGLWGQ